MSTQTQEQKDIVEIKGDLIGIKGEITSIRRHFDEFKKKQDLEDLSRISCDNMIREIHNALTDNEMNGQNGYIKRLLIAEIKVNNHDFYWKVLFGVVSGGAFILALIKIFYKFIVN